MRGIVQLLVPTAHNCALACAPVDDLVDSKESARRLRAAIAYAGYELKEFAELHQMSVGTLRNWTARTERATKPDLELRLQIADQCGVPRWFMEHGWAFPQASTNDLQSEVRELREQLAETKARQALFEAEVLQRISDIGRSTGQSRQGPPP